MDVLTAMFLMESAGGSVTSQGSGGRAYYLADLNSDGRENRINSSNAIAFIAELQSLRLSSDCYARIFLLEFRCFFFLA